MASDKVNNALYPVSTSTTPWWAVLLMGTVGLVHAFAGGWGAGILAALSILIAVLLFANLLAATVVLPFVIARLLIMGGIVGIVLSSSLRHESLERGATA